MKSVFHIVIFIFCLSNSSCFAQNDITHVPLDAQSWLVPDGVKAVFEEFDGRATVMLNGTISAINHEFSNGVIEVDVYANQKRSFAGISFRQQDGTSEEVYMRMHKSGQPDAVQYTPIYNRESSWQLYDELQTNTRFLNEGWNTLRIEVVGDRSQVLINGSKVLVVQDLKTDLLTGGVGLFSLFGNRFSNFRYSDEEIAIPSEKEERAQRLPGIITKWNLSEAQNFIAEDLDYNMFSAMSMIEVSTENSGLLPISKFRKKPSSGNFEQNPEAYAVALTTFSGIAGEYKQFSFDYSDKIIVYFNGERIFSGNNAFRAKGNLFKGNLRINTNTIYLPLKEGANTLHCVVIDRANGWGLMGRLE